MLSHAYERHLGRRFLFFFARVAIVWVLLYPGMGEGTFGDVVKTHDKKQSLLQLDELNPKEKI